MRWWLYEIGTANEKNCQMATTFSLLIDEALPADYEHEADFFAHHTTGEYGSSSRVWM